MSYDAKILCDSIANAGVAVSAVPMPEVIMAPAVDGAHWPVIADARSEEDPRPVINKDVYLRGPRAFGAQRDKGKRRTVGVTLFGAPTRTLVVAPLDCQVLRFSPWQRSTWIVYLRSDSCIFGIGGLAWKNFYCSADTRMRAGHVIGALEFSYGVHFQIWDRPKGLVDNDFCGISRSGGLIWWTAKGVPPLLLNPTEFLVGCGGRALPPSESTL